MKSEVTSMPLNSCKSCGEIFDGAPGFCPDCSPKIRVGKGEGGHGTFFYENVSGERVDVWATGKKLDVSETLRTKVPEATFAHSKDGGLMVVGEVDGQAVLSCTARGCNCRFPIPISALKGEARVSDIVIHLTREKG